MRRPLKWLAWALGGLIAIPVLLLGLLLLAGNIGPGRNLLADLVGRLTSGQVTVSGLGGGRFPDALTVQTVELRDDKGAWLTLHDVSLDWSPWQLVHRALVIDRFAAEAATLARTPAGGSDSSNGSSELPVRAVLRKLHVGRFEVAPAIAGQAYALALDGAATLDSLETGTAQLGVTRLGAPGSYRLDASMTADRLHVALSANEPPQGLIASVAGLPDLGAIAIEAALDGPRNAVATSLTVRAGELDAKAHGTLDLIGYAADLTVAARAPAMRPRPEVSWQAVALDARVHGPFTRPDATGQVRIDQLAAGDAAVRQLTAEIAGNQGLVHVTAQAEGLRLPGAAPELMAGAPLVLDATAHLEAPSRPITFALRHPLLSVEGSAQTAGPLQAQVRVTLPQLAPFAAVAGAALQGHTTLDINAGMQGATTTVAVTGAIGLESGPGPAAALVGNEARLDVLVSLQGQDITVTRLAFTGKDASASVSGRVAGGQVALDWAVALADLAAVQPTLRGSVQAKGRVSGAMDALALVADMDGNVAAQGIESGTVAVHLEAQGLPANPSGRVTAQGALLGAPLELAIGVQRRPDRVLSVAIDRADWKSAHADGGFTVNPSAMVPEGKLTFAMARLADLAPLLGQPLAGSVEARLDATSSEARVTAEIRGLALAGTAAVAKMGLKLSVTDPATRPVVDGELMLDGVSAGRLGGSAVLRAKGPQEALALQLEATLPDLSGAPARLDASGRLDVPQRRFTLAALRANWRQRDVRLLGPAQIGFANGISIGDLRLGLDRAVLSVAGKLGDTIALDARLRDLPADIAGIVAPELAADGTISAEARIAGTAARPDGTVTVNATGVRLRTGPGRAIPPASLTAKATLGGGTARLDATLNAGGTRLTAAGTVPVSGAGPLDVRATGAVDLGMANPLIAASGRRVTGRLTLDMRVTGTAAAPRIAGSAQIAGAEVQVYAMGVHLRAISATVQADGDRLRLTRFAATAGPGSLSGSGTISLTPPMPVDLTITANNATLVASEVVTERLNARLTISGEAAGNLSVQGTVQILHADIQIPEKLPQSVAVLPLRNPNAPAKPRAAATAAPAPAPDIALNLTITAQQVFVRGRGLDADLGGTIRVQGTAANPQPTGGLSLQRGTFSLAGQTLTFNEGNVDFIGAGISNPGLRFVATTTGNNVIATLTIGGTAQNPKITLSSSPQLPQDEILAQILFRRSVSALSPFEVAQIAAAVASFSGATSGLDPLADLRKSLGLDRLSVGTNAAGSPTVQAGRYVAPGVYLGAKQSATGTGTQASLQIDIAKGLKLETTTGIGGNASPGGNGGESGSSVGLTYQFEY